MKINEDELNYMVPEAQLMELIKDFDEKKDPLIINEYNDAFVLPVVHDKSTKWGLGGVVSKKMEFVDASLHPGYYKETENRFGGVYEFDVNDAITIDETIIYCDPIILQWGHFLVDSISRLWYALENDYKIAYCGFGFPQNELPKTFLRFFELLGINKERLIDVRKITKFKKIIIPELSYIADLYFTKEYTRIFDKIVRSVDYSHCDEKYDKVYFTRCQFKDNGARLREIGEKDVEDIFRFNGYHIFAPEKLSLDEQVYILNSCKEFAALSGTISHNILFANNISKFIILNKTSHTQRQQYYLNYLKKMKVVNIDVYKEPLIRFNIPRDTGYGPFLIGVSSHFCEFLKDNHLSLPHKTSYYNFKWTCEYIWLFAILPIRKVRFAILKIKRGIKKML